MTVSEGSIRDALAERLDVLEPGLHLIAKEYGLPNPVGGKGFVDILARDRFGIHVVIELKRSDATARQAIHEIYKYTALLRMAHGLAPDRVRCLVVSTDWHELRVPFAEFVRSAAYQVDGYHLRVDDSGIPLEAERIETIPEDNGLELCPTGFVFLFTSGDARDRTRADVESAAADVGVEDYLLIEQDYVGASERVIYPFADCFAMAVIDSVKRPALEELLELEPEYEEEGLENPFYFEELVQAEMAERIGSHEGMDTEISFPDKFRAHEDDWPVTRIRRYGDRLSSELRSDADLLEMVRGDVGGYSSKFERVVSPRVGPAWDRVRRDLNQCLLGNRRWEEGINAFLDEVTEQPPAGIALRVFNPTDLLIGLFKLRAERTPTYLPTAELILEPDAGGPLHAVVGIPEWDRATMHHDPQDLLDEFFNGDLMHYFMMRTQNDVWTIEDDLLRWHGLHCALYEVKVGDDAYQRVCLDVLDGNLHRRTIDESEDAGISLFEFARAHEDYLDKWVRMVRAQSLGL